LLAARLRAAGLPVERCFAPAFEQLVSVPPLPLPGAGFCVVAELFFGGHVGVVVPAGGAGA
jgi:hypothetical protein